ncbi:hypothetical protein AB6A40_005387 [Gnathostoma spinigerum]|uniref:Uncharacterized protein n=1 Tax=Gnathostoma spinigerum TaxID=75299 RepID=A0ABD6EFF8_9BILA
MERTETSEEENVFIKPVSCTERLSDGCSDGGSIRLRKRSKVQYHLSDENEGKETDSLINDEKTSVHSDSPAQLDLFHFIWKELTRGYSLQNDVSRYKEKRRKVYAFLRIPIELEKFLFYGFLQCVDAFFYLSTFLPIRFFLSVFGFLSGLRRWTSADTCDLLKVIIVVVASLLMQIVDTSIMYHQVRGQGIIKLYIFYNMLEVADKLFSSFGQVLFHVYLLIGK